MIHNHESLLRQEQLKLYALGEQCAREMQRPFVLGFTSRRARGPLKEAGSIGALAHRVYGDKDFRVSWREKFKRGLRRLLMGTATQTKGANSEDAASEVQRVADCIQ